MTPTNVASSNDGGGVPLQGGPDIAPQPLNKYEQARAMMKAKYGTPSPLGEPAQPLSTQPNQAKG